MQRAPGQALWSRRESQSSERVGEFPNTLSFSPLAHAPDPDNPTVDKGVIASKEAHGTLREGNPPLDIRSWGPKRMG